MLTAEQILDKEFLDARCMLIELGALMDRYDRAVTAQEEGEDVEDVDDRLQRIYQALDLLASPQEQPTRGEQLLHLFSDP